MSLSRINSDGTLPNMAWVQIDPPTQATSTPVQIIAAKTLCQRCIIRCDAANTGSIAIGPNSSANFVTGMAKTDEYTISAQVGEAFDLSLWYVSIGTNGDKIHVIYQP